MWTFPFTELICLVKHFLRKKTLKFNSTERNRRIKTKTQQANFCGEKTPTDNFPEWLLMLLLFSSHPETGDERKGLTRCTFYIENCYCSPPNLAHHLSGGLRRECRALMGGRQPTRMHGRREKGGGGGFTQGISWEVQNGCFFFAMGENFVFDCWLYLSFRGLIPVGWDKEIPLYVSVWVCVWGREDWWWDLLFFFPTAAAQRISRHPQGNITQVAFEQKSWILLMIC